jgi:hypothetical protein
MLKPLELDRDGPLDLVIEKEIPDDTRDHHLQLAQLPPKASAHGCESLIRDHLSRAHRGTSVVIDRTHSSESGVGMAAIAKIPHMIARTARANARSSS